jgi:DHA2 family multidrug resistance protein-like MFS transporter
MSGLGDRIGRRRLLVMGLGVFAAAAALAALAGSPEQLIAARVPARRRRRDDHAVDHHAPADGLPRRSRARDRGGSLDGDRRRRLRVGPVIGGALLEVLDWPWVFALQVPVVLAGDRRRPAAGPRVASADPGPWDPIGVVLSITGTIALVWGIKEVSKHGFGDAEALGTLALGAGALTAFVRRQRKLTHPLLDVALFRDRRFSTSALAVLAVFFGFGGLLLLLTQFLQIVQGHGPLEAGLRLLPLALAAGIASR